MTRAERRHQKLVRMVGKTLDHFVMAEATLTGYSEAVTESDGERVWRAVWRDVLRQAHPVTRAMLRRRGLR